MLEARKDWSRQPRGWMLAIAGKNGKAKGESRTRTDVEVREGDRRVPWKGHAPAPPNWQVISMPPPHPPPQFPARRPQNPAF